jgi:undecaprenyl-diphosphatase
MTWLQMLTLAVAQGLTEFLPVSSSGHLVLLQQVFGGREGDLFLVVLLHCGTLGSVLMVYRREVRRLLRLDAPARRYVGSLLLATLPAVVAALLAGDLIERLFNNPLDTGIALLITALLLFSARWTTSARQIEEDVWQPQAPVPGRALLIGCAQALAITPGISRSGATIAACLWAGLPRAEAARFSFLLSVPAIGGAMLLELVKGERPAEGGLALALLAAAVAFAVGLLAIRLTALAVVQRHFWKFGFYCLALGLVVILVLGTTSRSGESHVMLSGCDRFEEPTEGSLDALLVERLDDEIARPGLDGLEDFLLLTQSRNHDDQGRGILGENAPEGGNAVHARHGDVKGHQVGPQLPEEGDGLTAVAGLAHGLQAHVVEDLLEHHPHELGIIRDEDGVAHSQPPPCPWSAHSGRDAGGGTDDLPGDGRRAPVISILTALPLGKML